MIFSGALSREADVNRAFTLNRSDFAFFASARGNFGLFLTLVRAVLAARVDFLAELLLMASI
jgi:hypothetical protein